jgi:hypothetical protein
VTWRRDPRWLAAAPLIAIAWYSLRWPLAVDAPLLAYTALAIDRWGLVPYRDIVDFNTPGAYLANIAMGRMFGFTDAGFRVADLSILTAIAAASATALRRVDRGAAIAGPLCFGVFYLGYGPPMSLQREYLLLLPIAIALAVAPSPRLRRAPKAIVIGMLVGIAATIKPQAAIAWPALVGWLWWDERERVPERASAMAWIAGAALGSSLPLAAVTAWLVAAGAWPAFLDMAANYWPLYNELTGTRPHHVLSGADRWWYRIDRFIFSRDLRHFILIPAASGVWAALTRVPLADAQRRIVWLLAGVAIALQIYPLVAGKYWGYHWLPSLYGASMLAGLCFTGSRSALPRDFAVSAVLVITLAQLPGANYHWRAYRLTWFGTVPTPTVAMARELKSRLRPGDEVQPLDWTGGAVHALWLTNTRIATPFLYDFYFYHHPSTAYVQGMRRRFIEAMQIKRPAFVVVTDQQGRLEGPQTTDRFEELATLLAGDYCPVVVTSQYTIYERRDHAGAVCI